MSQARRNHQRFILGSLAVLWIAVLPWLCWGGWSNPHHPHPNPHFVFVEPSLLDAGHHDHATDLFATDPFAPADQDPLAGVARPDTLLIALLVLLLPVIRAVIASHPYHFARKSAPLWAHVATMAVPTPPPRTVLLLVAVQR